MMMKPVINSQSHRWCPGCKTSKELTYFSKSHRERLGVTGYCKHCSAIRAKKYFARRTKNRQMIKAKLVLDFGNKCFDCGVSNLPIAAFSFHHFDEKMNSKTYIKVDRVISSNQEKLISQEKKKWILLCSNCHNVRHSGCKLSAKQLYV